jgi:hypothetical protein
MKTPYLAGLVLGLSLISFGIGYAASSSNFNDVFENDWYYDGVTTLTNYGLLQGYSDGTFKPANDVNRAEMAVMMARMVDLLKNQSCVDGSKIYLEGDEWDDGETMYSCTDGSVKEIGAIN